MFLMSNEIELWLEEYLSRPVQATEPQRAAVTAAKPPNRPCRRLKLRARRAVTDGHTARVTPAFHTNPAPRDFNPGQYLLKEAYDERLL